jgi:hypothetical protein
MTLAVALATLVTAGSVAAIDAPVAVADAPDTSASSSAGTAQAITATQRARLAEKLRFAELIVSSAQQSDPATMTAERRRWMLESLYAMPLEQLKAMGIPGSFEAVRKTIAATSTTQLKSLGSLNTDLVYRPITPCRYVDTRVLGTPVQPGPVGSFPVDLGLTGASYGGAAGCNIVAAASLPNASEIAAIFMNVGIVNPLGAPGFFGARPMGSSNATSLVNWYQAGTGVQASDAAAVTTSGGATGTNQVEFFGTPTDLVVDILGVFTRPAATALDCTTVSQAGTGAANVPPGTSFSDLFAPPVCAAGYTSVGLGCEYGPTPPAGLALTSMGVADVTLGFVSCAWFNGSASTLNKSDFHINTRCCRVPGR